MTKDQIVIEVPGFALGQTNKVAGAGRLRCSWEVYGGIIPGKPEPEFTRRWMITSEVFYGELELSLSEEAFKAKYPDGRGTFQQFRDEAYDYVKRLTDPGMLNWSRVDWVYL